MNAWMAFRAESDRRAQFARRKSLSSAPKQNDADNLCTYGAVKGEIRT